MPPLRVYLAAPIFTPDQLRVVNELHALLANQGYEIFSPYHASRDIWAGRKPSECSPEERARVLRGNVEKLRWCDLLVAWLGGTKDGKTDTGVVWEMGFAAALTKGPPAMYEGQEFTAPDEKTVEEIGVYITSRPFTLGFIHPDDVRQGKDINLMLAGTIDAVVSGAQDFDDAIGVFSGTYGEANPGEVRKQYHPNRLLGHEEATIS
jgi:nucleoside 2-deoxyribosyltransferase